MPRCRWDTRAAAFARASPCGAGAGCLLGDVGDTQAITLQPQPEAQGLRDVQAVVDYTEVWVVDTG